MLPDVLVGRSRHWFDNHWFRPKDSSVGYSLGCSCLPSCSLSHWQRGCVQGVEVGEGWLGQSYEFASLETRILNLGRWAFRDPWTDIVGKTLHLCLWIFSWGEDSYSQCAGVWFRRPCGMGVGGHQLPQYAQRHLAFVSQGWAGF